MKSLNDNRTISHYRLLNRLGEGAMGVVYKAEDTRLGRSVALKLLAERLCDDPASLERFLREARAAASINHQNVCTIFDVHDAAAGDEPFIAMEFVEGVTLRRQIEGRRSEGEVLTVEEVKNYASQIARGLDAAHRAGIIHRDVKSENIMLDGEGRVKVMDFGLARLDGAERLTRAATMMGTISYMAPEVLQGSEPDARSDIFSFGVVLYEMLTGRLPFRGMHEAAMMYSIMHEAPPPLAGYRSDGIGPLSTIVERSLAKDREQRYASVGEILAELEPGGGSVIAPSALTGGRSLSRSRVRFSGGASAGSGGRSSRMSGPTELRVYISGASEDLHEEREYLMKQVFPELRRLCRERGITFTDVDLRWGLTPNDVSYGRIIQTSLEEIDRCRPYFIGIIGDSSGYTPSFLDIQKTPELLEVYPWIEDVVIDGMSITEIEAYYALTPGPSPSGRGVGGEGDARFYLRRQRASLDDVGDDSAERRRLEAFEQRVRRSGAHIEEFRDPSLLGEQIHEYLIDIIKRDFADARPPTPLEKERSRHEAFSQSRRRAYIANPLHLKRLNDHIASDGPPLVIEGESGSGKSSLFAYWAEGYRRKNPEAHIIEHYVGIGATATDHYAIIRHFCMEVKERFAREEEIPSEPAKLDVAFGQWLGYADYELTKRDERMVLLVDGLNQLHGSAHSLRWIPDVISPSIRLMVSSTGDGPLAELRNRGWVTYGIPALTVAEREAVVVRYLAEHRTSLDTAQIAQIAGDSKCGHPLFLKTLLEEVCLAGRHEELARRIDLWLGSTDTEDLFQRVLERMEDDYSLRSVRQVLVMLWGSRSGLTELELSELTGLSRVKIATMVAGLEYHLLKKEGGLSFFHDYLRRAVEKRYLGDGVRRNQMRIELARYFEGMALTQRTALELVWQYGADGEAGGSTDRDERLASTLARADVLVMLFQGETRYEMLERWTQLIRRGQKPEQYYQQSLMVENGEEQTNRGEALMTGGVLLELLGLWEVAVKLLDELVAWGRVHEQQGREVEGYVGLGRINRLRGEYADAMEHYQEALRIASELGDRNGISTIIGNIGIVHAEQGRYTEAMECFEHTRAFCEESGDSKGMAAAIGNMGSIHYNQGRYAEALECHRRKLEICEGIGHRLGVAQAFGNLGLVHAEQGRYAEAIECHRRSLSMSEEIGDRKGMVLAMGNLGLVYLRQGDYTEAMEWYDQKRAISEELGDRKGMALAIGSMGLVYANQGRNAEAMECHSSQLAISEEIGYQSGMLYALGLIGKLHGEQGRLSEAMECFTRQLAISEELGDRRGMATAMGNIGSVHTNQGRQTEAIEFHRRGFAISEEIGNRNGMAHAIGNMGSSYGAQGEYSKALECFVRQLAICEELGNRKGMMYAIGNMGDVHADQGRYAEALEHYVRAIEGDRAIGYRSGVLSWLEGIAGTLLKVLDGSAGEMPEYLIASLPGATSETWQALSLQHARECTEECIAISDELLEPDAQFSSRILLGRIEAAEGHVDTGVERLDAMLVEATDDDQRAELYYWLWKLGSAGHAAIALALYESLYAATPKHDYHQRIEELRASGEQA